MVSDVNQDGVDEFIVVADENNVILVGSEGRARWMTPFQTEEPVLQIAMVEANNQEEAGEEIAIAAGLRLILTNSSGQELWRRPLQYTPSQIRGLRRQVDGPEDILIAYENGQLQRIDGNGQLTWEYTFSDQPAPVASPLLTVSDLNRDGVDEIIYNYFADEGFSKLVLLSSDGQRVWERSNSGRVTAMAIVDFEVDQPLEIAVGTDLNRVHLYTIDGDRRWPYRSINKPITLLTAAYLDGRPALVVGTSVGSLIAYDGMGRRYWSNHYFPTPDRPIQAVTAVPISYEDSGPIALALVAGAPSSNGEASDVILLDGDGRRLEPSFTDIDTASLSRLVDINRDGKSELLLAGFATLELLDPGIGARQFFESWDYRLGAEPESVLVRDIDLDGEQEVLVGTDDGKLHVLDNSGHLEWVADLGGVLSHIDFAPGRVNASNAVIAIHNDIVSGQDGVERSEGWIEILRSNGQKVKSVPLATTISSALVGDINRSGPPELIVGTSDGAVIAFSISGEELWRAATNGSVNHLILVDGARGSELVIGTGANTINRLSNKGRLISRAASYLEQIVNLDQILEDERLTPFLVVGVEDGSVRGLSARGNQIWEYPLEGLPTNILPMNNEILVGTDEQTLLLLDNNGGARWQLGGLGRITSLYWGDLDGDVKPDIAVGNRAGEVRLFTAEDTNTWDKLSLTSAVFHLSSIRRLPDLQAELIAVTDNGVVQSFKSQANRPPLLITPQTDVGPGQYGISISVIDAENDPVSVALEIYDPNLDLWKPLETKVASGGNEVLFWTVNPPEDLGEVRYRFIYNDGSHSGLVEPAAGPPPIMPTSPLGGISLALLLGLFTSAGIIFVLYQIRSPITRARRFYQKLKQQTSYTLYHLEAEYTRTDGSPDFLLNLANQARQENDTLLSSLVDGLYLLSVRPESSLQVIIGALDEAASLDPAWRMLEIWQQTYHTGQALLTAPSITELTLLRPQLESLLQFLTNSRRPTESIAELMPVLNSLRDSERVELAVDRLVYLNEATGLIRQLRHHSLSWPVQIENSLVYAIADRWLGLIKAKIEDLHGRAHLVVNLLTRNLVPGEETVVALDIQNNGRAVADQIKIKLEDNPAYRTLNPIQYVPIISPGRSRQVQFKIEPLVSDQFRLVFSIHYSDRQAANKKMAFADMVHLLPPAKEFRTILNPYSPGMPLRRHSTVFVGREDLFQFIADNVGHPHNQNVLILIGQRRTGKTSVLLQLDQHLPEHIVPVYIDCQSLGVTPGMAALFHDLAWTIADALGERGLELAVPQPIEWQSDPAGTFQRHFIPQARSLLPEGTTILLVFDEFEAFENLVRDGILPATLFNYFRYLMQHGEGMSFIYAGTHKLEEMGTDYWSVLFNTGLYKQVGFLDDFAARRLIQDPVAPNLAYDDLAINKILRVTAGHPYFLQLVCYTLVNRANERRSGYVTISDVNNALDEMLRLGEVHFAYLWQRSTHTEKALLAAISRLMDFDTPFLPADLVQYLNQFSIYLDPGEVTEGLNRLVEREILREIASEGTPRYDLCVGLVGLWVSQNKSVTRLYGDNVATEMTQYADVHKS